jgi:hypothetical protein
MFVASKVEIIDLWLVDLALVLCLEQMKNNQKLRSEDLDAVSTM